MKEKEGHSNGRVNRKRITSDWRGKWTVVAQADREVEGGKSKETPHFPFSLQCWDARLEQRDLGSDVGEGRLAFSVVLNWP